MNDLTPTDVLKYKNKGNVRGLIKALYSRDSWAAQDSVIALGRLKEAQAVEPLLGLINGFYSGEKGIPELLIPHIVWTLGEISDIRSLDPLLEIAKLPSALSYLGDIQTAIRKIISAILKRNDCDMLASLLKYDSTDVRRITCSVLGESHGLYELQLLKASSLDPNESVRREVVESLHRIGNPNATQALCDLYSQEPNWDIREVIVEKLGKMNDDIALQGLNAALNDNMQIIRAKAARFLESRKP